MTRDSIGREFFWCTFLVLLVLPTSSWCVIKFERTYGTPAFDWGSPVVQTLDGGYIVAGATWASGAANSDAYVIKTDSIGDTIWTRTYGGGAYDEASSVQQTPDGGYIIAGYTESFGAGSLDVYLIKTDENGFVGVLEENGKPRIENRRLIQNLPNPFRSSTVISYSLPATGHVTLEVFDITGRRVETLVDERQNPGIYHTRWDTKNQASGIYFYRLRAGDFTDVKKMILLN